MISEQGFKSKVYKMQLDNYVQDGNKSYLYLEWCVGGREGGNCWGGSADLIVEAYPEPEFAPLDELLSNICPQITFLQYKQLCSNCIELSTRTQNEYYGNVYHYSAKKIYIDVLYKFLNKNGLLV